MHELSLISDLLKKIQMVAEQEGAEKVALVRVWIGALAHISAGHFREHFTEGSAGTLAQNAKLEIEMSNDITHPQAQDILLLSVDVVK